MLSIYDEETAAAVLAQPLDPNLRSLIEGRLADAEAIGLGDLTHILVIQPGDTEAMILEEIGWSPLVHPMEEIRFGEADFSPYWSWLEALNGWYEMVHPVSNDGFAFLLLIEAAKGVVPELLTLCAENADAPIR
jgi:hypothetical protein